MSAPHEKWKLNKRLFHGFIYWIFWGTDKGICGEMMNIANHIIWVSNCHIDPHSTGIAKPFYSQCNGEPWKTFEGMRDTNPHMWKREKQSERKKHWEDNFISAKKTKKNQKEDLEQWKYFPNETPILKEMFWKINFQLQNERYKQLS